MPTRRNPAYQDPYMAKAAENIAGLFAPPSGADMLGGQKAAQEKFITEGLAQLYANPTDPNFDRRATVLGRQTGATSLEAVGLNNARAISQVRLEQEGQTGRTNLLEAGLLARQFAQPITLSEGQTSYLPEQTQAATGLAPQLGGQVRVKPGERRRARRRALFVAATRAACERHFDAEVVSQPPEGCTARTRSPQRRQTMPWSA